MSSFACIYRQGCVWGVCVCDEVYDEGCDFGRGARLDECVLTDV